MSFEGTVQNGVVVLDSGHPLADGTRVEVIVRETPEKKVTLQDRLLRLAGTVDDLPADMARNHTTIPSRPRPPVTGVPKAGRLKGQLVVPDDFDEPLEELREYME